MSVCRASHFPATGSFVRPGDGHGRRGSALVVVLWVIGLLAILVGSFAFDAHLEARLTSYCRKRTKADYLARSGLEIAELLMAKSLDERGKSAEASAAEGEDRWREPARRLAAGLAATGIEESLGEGVIRLDLVPEPARRNVNLLKEDDWERILELGGLPEDRWPVLVDSFMDWLDRDDQPRADGAETDDYYTTLKPGYRARNGNLDTVEELLLVRGFDRSILFGEPVATNRPDRQAAPLIGIADLLTTYGDGKVNVNAASMRVLQTLPDVDEVVAGAIVEERESGERGGVAEGEQASFKDVSDLYRRIPDLPPALRNHVTTDSAIYRITSAGIVGGVRRQVWCIARYADKRLTILRWREED